MSPGLKTAVAKAIATTAGSGYSPIAPGTCGSAVAAVLIYFLAPLSWWAFGLVGAVVTLVGIWAAAESDRAWGTHDSGRIVIDEVAGMFVTLMLVPRGDLIVLVLGFFLFRFFDIFKPWPVRAIDRHVGGGTGVVLDDVAAGVYAAAVLGLLVTLEIPAVLRSYLP